MRRPHPRLLAPAVVVLPATACGTEHADPSGGVGAAGPAPLGTTGRLGVGAWKRADR
ncbi:hypothetical protein [Streptomyces sp. NPDC086519]|uniref:hypothetical protein n=1 Tax=Streptomyces sp. NPDC086519 TaxID=3154863 RepID=UPI003436624B